jgi:uncharacterized protein YbaR (Trm112 family)
MEQLEEKVPIPVFDKDTALFNIVHCPLCNNELVLSTKDFIMYECKNEKCNYKF